MKKFRFLSLAVVTTLLLPALTACSDDKNDEPDADRPTVSTGAFILNQGNYYKGIEGSLNLVDYATSTVSSNLFQKANGRSIGATPQCGLVYGSKIYIGTYESSTVEIADRNTLKSVRQISCNSEATGTQPRSMTAAGGYVYIAMYDGYIARLDTTTLSIDKTLKVGPNPETIAIHKGKLWVPNSDGMNWQVGYGTTASIVDIASFTIESTVEVPLNPNQFMSEGGHLYLLCKGDYGDVESLLYEIDDNIAEIQKDASKKETAWKKIARATMVCSGNNSIYLIDAPFSSTDITCKRYDIASSQLIDWIPEGLVYPSGMGVDPLTGDIFVTSYVMNGQWPSYEANGFALQYRRSDGKPVNRYEIGAGPTAIFFDEK